MKTPPLKSFCVENFKAVRDSGRIEFGWLTVLVGNNGSGKSSLIEAMESFREIVVDGLDSAMRRWHDFEQIWNKSPNRKPRERIEHRTGLSHPMKFRFDWKREGQQFTGQQSITQGPGGNSLFIQQEQIIQKRSDRYERWTRNDRGEVFFMGRRPPHVGADVMQMPRLADGESLLKRFAWETFERWHFLMLNPERMGKPLPQERTTSEVRLAKDGSNIAEYLYEFLTLDKAAYGEFVDAIRCVLPYAKEFQPFLATELGRAFYLRLREESFDLPGWLLSTGTLRIVALLACLRHPKPPPLVVVEEVENGLDPRTLNLLVEEIRAAITAGTTQVILTTHSPYLLDLLDLSHVVIVDRKDGEPVFWRPNEDGLAEWSKSFSPGRLYTMGRLTEREP
jgi:predicted ATPase